MLIDLENGDVILFPKIQFEMTRNIDAYFHGTLSDTIFSLLFFPNIQILTRVLNVLMAFVND
jgi:hypothetical protein